MKFFYILPLAGLAALGISINSAYYFDSFVTAGYPVLFAYGLSGSFMGLEAVIWLYPGDSWFLPILKLSIVLFSISATLGSQFFSTSELEANIEKIVYEELGTADNVEYYREQIKIIDARIDSIYREREEKTIYTLSEDSLKNEQSKKSEYEAKLEAAQGQQKTDVEKINKPMSIYSFYAFRIPAIISGEFGEDLVRVCFQLFSSVLLALIAPICLSMIKGTAFAGRAKTAQPVTSKPQIKSITAVDKERIAKVLLYFYPDKSIIGSEQAVKHFRTIKKNSPELREYTLAECEAVRAIVLSMAKDKKEKKEIIEGVINV